MLGVPTRFLKAFLFLYVHCGWVWDTCQRRPQSSPLTVLGRASNTLSKDCNEMYTPWKNESEYTTSYSTSLWFEIYRKCLHHKRTQFTRLILAEYLLMFPLTQRETASGVLGFLFSRTVQSRQWSDNHNSASLFPYFSSTLGSMGARFSDEQIKKERNPIMCQNSRT